MKKQLKKILTLVAVVVTMTVCFAFSSEATINWGRAVYISQYGQVVDSITHNGVTVNAVYAPRNQVANYDEDGTFCCAAFVKKFYSSVYGVSVVNLIPGRTPSVNSGGGYFYKVSTPQVGDIAANSGHWAIVKAVSGNTVTLVEQNTWNLEYNSAQVGRTLVLPESSYWFWRWSGNSGGNSAAPSYFTGLWHGEVSDNNARIDATINLTYIQSCGFYLGTSTNNMKRIDEPTNANVINIWFNLKDYYGPLASGTTYYYKIYIVVNGVEYVSNTQSFTTSHTHAYTVKATKATLKNNGMTIEKCSCGAVKSGSEKTVYSPKTFTLSKTKYIYDGKNKTPTVTIKDSKGNKLVKNRDYKLSVASKRNGIGRYTVKVTFIGNYSGTKNLYFYIKPGKTAKITASSQTTSAVKLTWSAVPGAAGYTVYRYSPSKKAYVKAGTTTGKTFTVKKLYAGTNYTFKVVAYGKTSGGKVYNSDSYTLFKASTRPATPSITKLTTSKGKANVTWSNVGGESGYEVNFSSEKNSGYRKLGTFKANVTNGTRAELTKGNTYFFRVRAYKTVNGTKIYSAWSPIRSIKIK